MEGKILGSYRIESELGSGGMGKVYLAERGEDRFALKIVHPHLLSEPGFFKRFLREAEIGKAVTHPNVVRCYDCDQLIVDNAIHAFLVMEYVEGQTLRELLDELETVPEELCRHIGREVSKGLAAIHEAGVIHRDLKPENVLITPEHEVKIMDLGVARLAEEAVRLSVSGAFVGSVLYASPEQFHGQEPDGRADLFALGVMLYELSTGAHPHPGDDFASVLAKVVEEEPRRLGSVNPQLSPYFEELVHALLAKKREDRFPAAAELALVLTEGEKSAWWTERAKALRIQTKRPLRRVRIPRETAVYGRDGELGRLRGWYEQAKSGDGRVVLIEGEAGIGKTRLVDELVARLQADGEDVNFLFGSYPPGGAATASGAWSTAYREHFGAEGLEEALAPYLTVTPILIPAFAALLKGEPPPKGEEELTKDSLQTVFVHATRALAAERATIVLIEDLHFAPEEGRAMFASLALAAPEHPILLVGTARPGLPEDWRANLERLDQASRLELSRLGAKDLALLLRDAFHSERLADELGIKIAVKCDGNPFFTFEIIRGLREGQFITKKPDGTWATTKVIRDIEVPSSVLDLVNARVASLSEEERDLLDVAACCGFEFDPGLVAAAAGLSRIPALKRLGQIERAHRLIRSSGRSYCFDHHQVQEAMYGSLHEQMRQEYHAAIGDALAERHPEPDGPAAVSLCEHFLKGGTGERALPHLDVALDHLCMSYLNVQAVAIADAALGVEGLLSGTARMEVLLRKVRPLDLLARRAEQRDALEEAILIADETDDPLARARVRVALGGVLAVLSDSAEAKETLEAALEFAREAGDARIEAGAMGQLGNLLALQGNSEDARVWYEKSCALRRRIGDRDGEISVVGNLGNVLLRLGLYKDARACAERRYSASLEIGSRRHEMVATGDLCAILSHLGRSDEALEWAEKSLALARETGDRTGQAASMVSLGITHESLGSYDAAEGFQGRALEMFREIGNRIGEATAYSNRGRVLANLGRIHEAQRNLEACREVSVEIRNPWLEAYAIHGLGVLAVQRCDREQAKKHLEGALALRRELSDRPGVAATLAALGSHYAGLEQVELARRHLEEALLLGHELPASGPLVLASCDLALLPGGDAGVALSAFFEQESQLDHGTRMHARFDLYRATSDPAHLAEAHRLLSYLRDHAPEGDRASMIAKVPLHRNIMAAWAEHQAAQ